MKAPINFAKRIKGYKMPGSWSNVYLGDCMGADDKVWIYPKDKSTPNSIMLEFRWDEEEYRVCISKNGDGTNFHTILKPWKFNPKFFTSFDTFIGWLFEKLGEWGNHFYN
jgi:hypothetical protein